MGGEDVRLGRLVSLDIDDDWFRITKIYFDIGYIHDIYDYLGDSLDIYDILIARCFCEGKWNGEIPDRGHPIYRYHIYRYL